MIGNVGVGVSSICGCFPPREDVDLGQRRVVYCVPLGEHSDEKVWA